MAHALLCNVDAPSPTPPLILFDSFDKTYLDYNQSSNAGATMLERNDRSVKLSLHAGCYLKTAASVFIANANPAWTSGAKVGGAPSADACKLLQAQFTTYFSHVHINARLQIISLICSTGNTPTQLFLRAPATPSMGQFHSVTFPGPG